MMSQWVVPSDSEENRVELSGLADEKVDEQINSLIDRENDELREANQQWFEKCEELYAENKNLNYQILQTRKMLLTGGYIALTMLICYAAVAYTYILAGGLSK